MLFESAAALQPQADALAAAAEEGPAGSGLVVHGPGDPRRGEVEAFIRTVYARRYAARPDRFAPSLMALRDGGGALVAAAGYRRALAATLFLERYLPAPADVMLARCTDGPVPRAAVFEVGHLAARVPGAGRRLIGLVGPHLAAQGCEWVVCTLTRELRHLFMRLGIAPLPLAVAEAAALGADAARWGSYYAHAPQVVAGHLPEVLRRLAEARR